jgi:hypothetical protein
MRLEGASKDLTEASRIAFEQATEEFYRSTVLGTPARRRLQGSFDDFRTDVTASGEALDTQGMSIPYEQFVRFRLSSGSLSEIEMQKYLLNLINQEQNQQQYIQLLRNNDQDFNTVQSSNARTTDSDDDDDDDIILGLSLTQVIIYLLVICIVPCCCRATCFWMKKYRDNRSEKLYDDREKNELAYEAPAGDAYYAGHESIDQGYFVPEYGMPEEGYSTQGDAFADEFDQNANQDDLGNDNDQDDDNDSQGDDSESESDEEDDDSDDEEEEEEEDDSDDDSTVSDGGNESGSEPDDDSSGEIAFPRHRNSFAGID